MPAPLSKPSAPRGRPREFDYDEAVDQLVDVFRQRGYTGTAITDLMAGTGLTRGSFYKAFVDKPSAFALAFERYVARGQRVLADIVNGPGTGKERLRLVLQHYLGQATGPQGRLGCLVVATAAEATVIDRDAAQRVDQALSHVQGLFKTLVQAGVADGSLPRTLDADATAAALLCLVQGFRVAGKSPALRKRLGASLVDAGMKLLD